MISMAEVISQRIKDNENWEYGSIFLNLLDGIQ